MIALIDYGAGNVRSVEKALRAVGAEVTVTQDPAVVRAAEKVVLPGVGAFADCMGALRRLEMIAPIEAVVARGAPFLGICVGMQVLFEEGTEMGVHPGLGLLPGRVVRFDLPAAFKVPHTGWNQLRPTRESALFEALPTGLWAYFNHSFYCAARPEETIAVTDYGGDFPCAVQRGNLYGIQFHPEKSQDVGLHILRNFVEKSS
ncbi:MAG: imidazole glycerol phosphate synthase subunit HisH [Chloroflexi bacterium]|jgi:glutamine amidotransferase|nr:imidazole glycerol phosphate synthase subunit HisH [Chloroflexota bacterium]